MNRRPPRSTQSRSSAASDVYKRQLGDQIAHMLVRGQDGEVLAEVFIDRIGPVSYTHLRAHETRHDLVCRLLLEKKKKKKTKKKNRKNKNTKKKKKKQKKKK